MLWSSSSTRAALFILATWGGCLTAAAQETEPLVPGATVITVHPGEGSTFVRTLSEDAFSRLSSDLLVESGTENPPSMAGKLHPVLREQLRSVPPDHKEDLVITFRDRMRIPRFPEPAVGQRPDSPANQLALAEAARLVEQIRVARRPVYAARGKELSLFGVEVLETFG